MRQVFPGSRLACPGLVLSFLLAAHLPSQIVREVRVPLVDGRVSVLDLSRALLDEYGFAGEHLSVSDVRVDVSGAKGFLILAGISKALKGTTSLRRVDGGETLLLAIDRAKVREVRQGLKRNLLQSLGVLTGRDLLARSYELELPANLGTDDSLVLLVHGVDSSPRTFADMRAYLAPEGIASGTFGYANDEAIDRIAAELSIRLKEYAESHPDRDVLIVAHSMGGLDGVQEVIVPLDHLALLRPPPPDESQPVFVQVLEWIRAAWDK